MRSGVIDAFAGIVWLVEVVVLSLHFVAEFIHCYLAINNFIMVIVGAVCVRVFDDYR